MADRVLPGVSLLLPCRDAVYDLAGLWWTVSDPWTVMAFPETVHGNFDFDEFWVYAHLTDGVGEFDLHIEMRLLHDDAPPELIGRGPPTRMEFSGGLQLLARDTAFPMRNIPFDTEGVYEFSVWANHASLQGLKARLRVLDLGRSL